MNLRSLRRPGITAALVLTLSTGLAACSDSDTSSSSGSDGPAAESTPSEETSAAAMSGPFGEGCAGVPSTGEGSVEGMTDDPVATAASNNPLLSTLVEAVGAVPGLADTLNGAEELTVFAPVNDAFAAVPKKDLQALLADEQALTAVLSHHVVPQRLEPDEVAGEHETLNGDMVTVEGDAEGMTVAGATVVCGGVQTANATVYVIDTVLMPTA